MDTMGATPYCRIMPATAGRGSVRSSARAVVLAGGLLVLTACTSAPAEPVLGGPAATAAATAGSSLTLPPLSFERAEVGGLGFPWSMVVLDDGRLLVSDRETGEILRISGGTSEVIGRIADASSAAGEGGLLGLAVPTRSDPAALYAYYTSAEDNRVVRFPLEDGVLGAAEPVLTGIPRAATHNGGRIAFGPDGHLYIGTGDVAEPEDAQDRDSLGGKILRVTADGGVPSDNPFPGSPVYSFGHRNVQGLAWDSGGRLWSTEFGPEVDDELNLVRPGANYGWPDVTGAPVDPRFVDAQVVWPSTASSSPSGMAIVDDVAYIGGLRGQRLWQVPVTGAAAGVPVSHFDGTYGRLRDVAATTDGALLVATNEAGGARILRVAVGQAQ
jgi:glucose/arabinose dehydrogenase